jgi:HK97 family phage major capsid protein
MAEVAKLIDEVKSAFHDHQEISTKNYDELKSNGQEMGQSIEKLQNCIKDIETKFTAVEKAVARKTQEKNAKDALEMDLKSYNDMLKTHGKEAVDLEQMNEVKSAFDKYIRKGTAVGLSNDEQKSLNTVIDPQGGFFVVPQYSQNIVQKKFDGRGLMDVVEKVTTSSGVWKEIIDWADYDDSYYSNELATATDDQGGEAFKEVTWNASEQIYTKKFSRVQLEDSFIDIESYILGKLREGSIRESGDLIVSGNGVDKPRGYLTYDAGTTYGTIEQITSSSSGVIKWADVIQLLPSALKDPYHANASYVMNRGTFFALLADVDGNARFQVGNQINFFSGQNLDLAILGAPVKWEVNMNAVATNGLSVAYGDFREAYTFIERLGFSVLRDETNPKFVKLHLRRRNDGKVKNFEATKILKIQ